MDTSQFMEELATECKNRNVSPQDLVDYVIEAKEGFRVTRRGLGKAAALLGVGALAATGTASASTSQGQVSANSGQFQIIEGPSDTTVINLANDRVDMSNTEWGNLPQYNGSPGGATTVGDFWYDTSAD